MDSLKLIFEIIGKKQKNKFFLILFLIIFAMLLETLSIGAIIPFLSLATSQTLDPNIEKFIGLIKSIFKLNTSTILILFLLLIFLLKNIYLIFIHKIQSKFTETIKLELSRKLFNKYLNEDYTFYLNRNTSILFRNITTEIGSFVEFLTSVLTLFAELIVFLGIIILLLLIDYKITITVAILSCFFGLIIIIMTKNKLSILGKERINVDGKINKYFIQGLSAVKEVKLLQVSHSLFESASESLKRSSEINFYFRFLNGIIKYLFEILVVILFSSLVLILISLNFSYQNIIQIVGLFAIASFRILPAISRISISLQQIRFREFNVKNVYNEIKNNHHNLKNNIDGYNKVKNDKNVFKFKNEIKIKDLNFSYPNRDKLVLKNISLKINKGQFVGIVGKSGSGKTTLINLLIGLLKSNAIFCDDKNILDNLTTWQKNIGYVAQDTFLIDDTIRRNIAFGHRDDKINNTKVENSVEKAQLSNFLMALPKSLETIVGEKGLEISGGQKQRIGIARALYNDPDILIFDESTSSLDEETEKNFLLSINRIKSNKTVIFVTHRRSVLKDCDKVFCLDSGSIVFSGTPLEFKQKFEK